MIEIKQSFGGIHKTFTLDESQIKKAVKSAIGVIKKELPEEAQTVEVMEYIISEMNKTIEESRVIL